MKLITIKLKEILRYVPWLGLLTIFVIGLFKNVGITDWFYMQYLKPTIDFNMQQYIISSSILLSNSCLILLITSLAVSL